MIKINRKKLCDMIKVYITKKRPICMFFKKAYKWLTFKPKNYAYVDQAGSGGFLIASRMASLNASFGKITPSLESCLM